MTVQPLDAEDREVLRRRAQDRLAKAREWNATANPPLVARMSDRVQIDAGDLLALLDQLDAAEQRIRDLTQEVKDERGAALDQMEQVRIRDALIDQMTASEKFFSRLTEAEARIAAVDAELLYAELHGNLEVWTANIRRALER